jgi:hypothetical protein
MVLKEEIQEVMSALDIKRMPSRSEIKKVTGGYALVSAIGRYGGFLQAANQLGLDTKGRNQKYKWNDKKIEEGIRKVVEKIGVERMPTSDEVSKHFGNGLRKKISSGLGYKAWAKKLNLPLKSNNTNKSLAIEEKMIDVIKKKTGLIAKLTPIKHPFDLLVENKVKIEIKYSEGYKDSFFSANLRSNMRKSDIVIFVCENPKIGNKIFVIPSWHIEGKNQLGAGKKSKYDKYLDRWDYIKKYNNALNEI